MTSEGRRTGGRLGDAPASFWVGVAIPLALGVAAYIWVCFFFIAHQHEFQFAPGGRQTTPQAVGLVGFAAIRITTADGERLDAWWASPAKAGAGVVLFLHGTPGTLADTAWRLGDLRGAGLGAMAIDYRGYGGSTGTPSEAGFRVDARAAFDYVSGSAPGSKIAVFGESLGTWPAVALACDRPVAGVLLNSPYASVRRLFELEGPPLPYGWLMRDQFDTEALIGKLTAPVMILAGAVDRNVPVGEARRLFAAAHEPKAMIELPGAGHLGAYAGASKAQALATLVRWTAADNAGR
jgi:fermentation-respiration switch protein FrsA (DUF1100 family)